MIYLLWLTICLTPIYIYIYVTTVAYVWLSVANLKINEFITTITRNIFYVCVCVCLCMSLSYREFPGKWHFTRSLSHIARGKYSILFHISIFIHIKYRNTFISICMYMCVPCMYITIIYILPWDILYNRLYDKILYIHSIHSLSLFLFHSRSHYFHTNVKEKKILFEFYEYFILVRKYLTFPIEIAEIISYCWRCLRLSVKSLIESQDHGIRSSVRMNKIKQLYNCIIKYTSTFERFNIRDMSQLFFRHICIY